MWTKEERKLKVYQRQKLFEGLNKPIRSYLSLPGIDCEDVRYAWTNNFISPSKTYYFGIEKSSEIFSPIKEWFSSNWKHNYALVNDSMANIELDRQFDLAFIDLLGNINYEDAYWIRNMLCPNMLPHSRVGITINTSLRYNSFIPRVRNFLLDKHKDYYFDISDKISQRGEYPQKIMRCLTTYTILCINYLFAKYDFKINYNYYKEEQSTYVMTLFRIDNLVKKYKLSSEEKSIEESISGIVEKFRFVPKGFERKVILPMAATVKDGLVDQILKARTPGQKAAATRRLNAFARQRAKETGYSETMVAAGIKASVSRRRNGN